MKHDFLVPVCCPYCKNTFSYRVIEEVEDILFKIKYMPVNCNGSNKGCDRIFILFYTCQGLVPFDFRSQIYKIIPYDFEGKESIKSVI